jgi:hypothetical protein
MNKNLLKPFLLMLLVFMTSQSIFATVTGTVTTAVTTYTVSPLPQVLNIPITVNVATPNLEYIDYVSFTLPAGITPAHLSPVAGSPACGSGSTSGLYCGVATQTVSWAISCASLATPTACGFWNPTVGGTSQVFTITVSIPGNYCSPISVDYSVGGDGYQCAGVCNCGNRSCITGSLPLTPFVPLPTAVTATPSSICAGSSADLSAISAGNNIFWYTDAVGGVSIGNSPSGANFPVSPAITTTYYASQSNGLAGSQTFNYSGSIVNFVVPVGVNSITINAKGAQGGAGGTAPVGSGGLGANMTGTFAVVAGQTLKVLVGQQGQGTAISSGASGGGGTFVTDNSNNPMIIAGGGGGVHGTLVTIGKDAVVTNNGVDGYSAVSNPPFPTYYGVGGVGGNGATNGPNAPHAGNGGGLLTAGAGGSCGGPGASFISGGTGGTLCSSFPGGFGGGGGDGNNGGGGGGGYSGGGGSYHTPTNGGGGGSFNIGTNQTNIVNNTGNGQVVISWVVPGCESGRVPVTVTVNPLPAVTATATPAILCLGSSSVLTGGGAATYTWNPGGLVGNPSVSPITNTTYTVTGTDANGCTATSTVAITLENSPVVNTISSTPASICPGAITSLTAAATVLAGAPGPGPYTIEVIPFAPVVPAGPTNAGPTGDDNVGPAVNIGFPFQFYGNTYTQLRISTNGFLSFNPAVGSGCCSGPVLPTAASQTDVVAIAWNDLNTAYGGTITYYNLSSPNRFVLSFNGVGQHGGGGAPLTGQAILYEDGVIDINITSVTSDGSTQTLGIQNSTGSLGSAPPAYNGVNFTASNIAYRFSQFSNIPVNDYAWSPAVLGNIANPAMQTTDASPNTTTVYTVTATSANGCTATSTVTTTVYPVTTGSASVTPNPLCLGQIATFNGSVPTNCPGGNVVGFADGYAPGTWSLTQVNSNGTVNTAGAPANIIISSGSNLSGTPGSTNYSHAFGCPGTVTFNWNYTHGDAFGSIFDYPRYSINGGAPVVFAGFIIGGPNAQNGTENIVLAAGDVLELQAYTVDNDPIPGNIAISNFSAPTPQVGGTVSFWDAAVGGTNLGAPPVNVTPVAAGTLTYYAEYTTLGTGCVNPVREPVTLTINPNPVVAANATPNSTCEMTSVTPDGSGAVSYMWSGGLMNNVPFVANATTTYTVTGTDGAGCTATSTVTVTVNPMSGILAPATSNQAQDHGDDFDINYYAANCDLIATVDDGAGGNVLGLTTSTVNVDATAGTHNGQPFVRRWYQITPTTNGAADVVLYINQSDFDDYNAAVLAPYLPLPTSGNNADPNIANIRITKNDDAGLGNNPVVITPTANWNGTYWELSFSTPNFSQFRVHSVNPGNVPLPATVTNFSGLKLETSDKLSWITSSEHNNAYFNLQHSTDGINFTTIATINSKAANGNSASSLNYSTINAKPSLGHNYYRLQQTDLDNKLSVHAEIVDLIWGANGSTVSIYPNPTTDLPEH